MIAGAESKWKFVICKILHNFLSQYQNYRESIMQRTDSLSIHCSSLICSAVNLMFLPSLCARLESEPQEMGKIALLLRISKNAKIHKENDLFSGKASLKMFTYPVGLFKYCKKFYIEP